nr:MAG TPA: hypothetical protein [Caudoviricetes sp.]
MVIWIIYIAMCIAVIAAFINEVRYYAKMWKDWTDDDDV